MTYETQINKSKHNGVSASTRIELGEVPATQYEAAGIRVLTISTAKHSNGGIWSHAGVMTERGSSRSFEIFNSYSKTIQRVPCDRVTEKAIMTAHTTALEQAEAITAEAKAFYVNDIEAYDLTRVDFPK